jgi:hypothetical protein
VSLRRAGLALLAGLLLLPAAVSSADSFTPVTLSLSIPTVARLGKPLQLKVAVAADPGVLDTSEGPLRIEAKLAGECGADFQTTTGVTLINKQLNPQPATGKGYSAEASGRGTPTRFGVETLCVFLEDSDVGRVYANDESIQVNVSQPCTVAANRVDRAFAVLSRAEKLRKHTVAANARRLLTRTIRRDRRALRRDRRSAHAACGLGVKI